MRILVFKPITGEWSKRVDEKQLAAIDTKAPTCKGDQNILIRYKMYLVSYTLYDTSESCSRVM